MDPNRNKLVENPPRLSMIFNWYGMDFNKDGKSVKDFVNEHATVKITDGSKIEYLEYDWSLNE
jgi:hypothetical protein